ncbi:Peptidyl-prolyl cis-trans isomerase A (Cyclophilin A) [Sphingomonas sp. EC-HK361]|uniref:peptidylprolyl isomerase n=1 Tax=Sphingomonas sp. EC-HK361 TaxID=2038397 RepID=UPI00125569A2|nr:peptidylprolyl isomerase [Sphingomonas sp. EC-HK361]VVT08605.1 Peptidyl-prolyl cis-trans isomerase A (Cyclophilin A) [Sphingomonas sp. EC-HK361]
MRRAVAVLLLATIAAPAPAQNAPRALAQNAPSAPAPVATPLPATRVTLTTADGPIVIAVDTVHAPITAANFLRYVDQKKLDGAAFYRAVNVAPGYGLAQFGTRNDPKRTLPPIAHEPTSQTGLSHVDGAISMAMAKPGTAAGDFFIVIGDLKSMDATTSDPGFAVFGRVVEGMDIVKRILASPTSPTEGEGVMKGQMLSPTIRIVSARKTAP